MKGIWDCLPSLGGIEEGLKELNGLPIFKIVVGRLFVVRGWLAIHLDAELVERVVITAAHSHRPPHITVLDAPLQSDGIKFLLVGQLLLFIFLLKKKLLPL